MRRKLLTAVLSGIALALFLTVPRLSAQDDIFVTPIPNAPFSGVINVERSIVRQDGTVVNLKTVRAIHRDFRGRICNEYRTLLPASSRRVLCSLQMRRVQDSSARFEQRDTTGHA